MEKQYYSVPLSELLEHMIQQSVPRDAIVHYWYERKTAVPKPKYTNWDNIFSKSAALETNKANERPLNTAFLFADLESAGGLSLQAANEMHENSKQFKDEFWFDKD